MTRRQLRRPAPLFTDADLPPGPRGVFLLTPEISNKRRVHVIDIERILRKRGKELDVDLWLSMDIVQQGIQFSWGLADELDTSEMELVEESDDETSANSDPGGSTTSP